MKKYLGLLFLIFFICGLVGTARADLITSSSDIDIPYDKTIVDFNQFSGDDWDSQLDVIDGWKFTTGPIQVGDLVSEDITWSLTSGTGMSAIGNGFYPFGSNGYWNSGRMGYIAVLRSYAPGSDTMTMKFSFNDGPVAAVGGFVNYAPGYGDNFAIIALASDNSVLESVYVVAGAPIDTQSDPGEDLQLNAGAFRGFSRTENDIAAITLSGNDYVLDDLTFGRAESVPVPEPATCLLLLFGFVGMIGVKKKVS